MKYRYSILAFICNTVLVGAVVMLLLYLFGVLINADKEKIIKVFIICPAFYAAVMIGYSSEYTDRYVELYDNYIRFNSFRFKRVRNTVSFNIKYEDVISIKTKSFPIIGLCAVKIKAKNFPHEITLSICFCKHKELYREICQNVVEYNEDINIDKSLQKLINNR